MLVRTFGPGHVLRTPAETKRIAKVIERLKKTTELSAHCSGILGGRR